MSDWVVKHVGLIVSILVVVALLLAGATVQVITTNDRQDTDIDKALYAVRESQYRACILNGNTLRDDIRDEFVDLKESVLIPVFGGVAATIPEPTASRQILEDSVRYMRERIKTIKDRFPDVDCLRVYPPLPGQTYPDIGKAKDRKDAKVDSSPVGPPGDSTSAISGDSAASGGGGDELTPPASSQPPPPPSGGGNPPPGNPQPPSPPPNPPSQPEPPGLLDPVTDPLGLDCHITALGLRICT